MRRGGFTLIEMLVVIVLTVAIATAGFLGLSGYRNKQALESGLDEFRAAVEATKRRSVAQEEGSRWGMRFTNATSGVSSYAVFKGSSYSTSGLDRTYSFREPVGFANPSASSTYDVVFSPLSGALSENKVITLVGGSDGLIGDLILRTIGSITARNEKDMVGYWHLDEGTSTIAYDASGNGDNGTLTNGPTWQSGSSCKAGGCLSFDGTNDYIQLTTLQSYTNAVTVEAWVLHNASSDWDDIVAGGCGNILFGFSNNYLSFGGQCNNPFSPVSYITNINSTWRHVAGVYDGSLASIYVDGVRVASSTKSGSFSVFTPRIGGEGASESFNGRIDEVRIYDRALTADEILAHYNDLK